MKRLTHRCGLGLIPEPGVTCVDFVVGSFLSSVGYSLALTVCLPLQKPHLKFQFDLEKVDKKSYFMEFPLLNYHFCSHSHLFPFTFNYDLFIEICDIHLVFFPISKGDEGPRGVNGPRGPRGRQVSLFVF